MRVEMAHLRTQGMSFAVFAADANDHASAGRQGLLGWLVAKARGNNLRVDKAALVFHEAGRSRYFGTPDLVQYLSSSGVGRWTHTIDV